jgi:hypothetical protein
LFVAGGLLAGGVIAAAALTATGALASAPAQKTAAEQPTPPPSQQPGPNSQPGMRHGMMGPGFGPGFGGLGRGVGGALLHGEIVVKTSGGTETELLQSGNVIANPGSTVTVRSSDGFTVTWSVGTSTSIRTGRATGSVKDLAVGTQVTAMGTKTAGGGTATFIGERPQGGSNTPHAPVTQAPAAQAPAGSA